MATKDICTVDQIDNSTDATNIIIDESGNLRKVNLKKAVNNFTPPQEKIEQIQQNTNDIAWMRGDISDLKTQVSSLSDENAELKGDIANKIDKYVTTISVNRFDKTKATNGALNAANGNVINQETATSFVSDFCDIATLNTSGKVSVARASGDNWLTLQAYAFYDKHKVFISGSYTYTNPLSIPSNAVYIRFQINITWN